MLGTGSALQLLVIEPPDETHELNDQNLQLARAYTETGGEAIAMISDPYDARATLESS